MRIEEVQRHSPSTESRGHEVDTADRCLDNQACMADNSSAAGEKKNCHQLIATSPRKETPLTNDKRVK